MSGNGPSGIDMILIAMPWQVLNRTPIQLGILKPVVEEAGFSISTRSFFVSAMEYFAAQTADLPPGQRITVSDYHEVVYRHYGVSLGEWIFVVPPYHQSTAADDAAYTAILRSRNVSEEMIAKAFRMRALAPSFLKRCADEVLAAAPRVVGFTTCFNQNVPSLALAKLLKESDPSLHIVFGGGNCDGPMGAALHRAFPWVDTVVRGEGEHVLPELLRDVLSGASIRPQPGLCYRGERGESIVVDGNGELVQMSDVPCPNYDDFFAHVDRSPLRGEISSKIVLLYESARGCWWGEKMHCTFCGLNGSTMKFRSKPSRRVTEEIYHLSSKYKRCDFEAVDNIIALDYMHELLPALRDFRNQGYDFKTHYETKANLKKDQVRLMRAAGVRSIQPGIESISNTILKLMRKGVSGLQNIRLLKWAAQFDIHVTWNILYGFPGEPEEEYERMANVARSLTHLCPPNMGPVTTVRFSPYHQSPREFGITLEPAPHYRLLYPSADAETLNDIAYDFDHVYDDGRIPYIYVGKLREFVNTWRGEYDKKGCSLTYRRGPGFLVINDRRPNLEANDYYFERTEAQIYLLCDAGASPIAVWKALRENGDTETGLEEVRDFLDTLVEARLAYEEEGRYLSLAIPSNTEADDPTFEAPESEVPASLVQIVPLERQPAGF